MKRIEKTILIVLLFAINLCVASENSFAQSKRKTIQFACIHYPPLRLKDGTGPNTDMLTELFHKMGYDIAIQMYPLARAIALVNEGKIQAAILWPQTDNQTTVAIPIYYSANVFIFKKSRFPNGVVFDSLSDLKKYKIGALVGSKWTIKLLQEDANLQLEFAPDNDMNIKKLYAERIDLLPLWDITALSVLESVFPDKKEEFGISKPIALTPECLIFSKKYTGNKKIIDDVQKKIQNIDMASLIQKHFGKYYPNGIAPSYTATGRLEK